MCIWPRKLSLYLGFVQSSWLVVGYTAWALSCSPKNVTFTRVGSRCNQGSLVIIRYEINIQRYFLKKTEQLFPGQQLGPVSIRSWPAHWVRINSRSKGIVGLSQHLGNSNPINFLWYWIAMILWGILPKPTSLKKRKYFSRWYGNDFIKWDHCQMSALYVFLTLEAIQTFY